MSEPTKFVIRCRAVILHEGKLLVVKHSASRDIYALPGGHLDPGEDVQTCMKREIIEELNIEPELGRLLYVHTFIDRNGVQPVEFFFEVKNGADFADIKKLKGTHSHELVQILWASPEDGLNILPVKIREDFENRNIVSSNIKYITNLARKSI